MTRWIDRFCRLLDGLVALLLAAMVVLVFGNVLLRYTMNTGITVSEEASRWLFVWMTFLGAVVALKERAHLGTDMLVSRLGAPATAFAMAGYGLMRLKEAGAFERRPARTQRRREAIPAENSLSPADKRRLPG